MACSIRAALGRALLTACFVASATSSVACASILGIDDGLPKDDGGSDASARSDAAEDGRGVGARDAHARDEEEGATDAASGDAPVDEVGSDAAVMNGDADNDRSDADARDDGPSAPDAGEACAPDPTWCRTHCGQGLDDCGFAHACAATCPIGWTCNAATSACECRADPSWCTGRCGTTSDSCGSPVDCVGCDGGACVSQTCGCVPQGNPCGALQCGQALDSCGHPVNCGANGTTACAAGTVCTAGGTCCAPNGNACAGGCNAAVNDGCGGTIVCACTAGDVCNGGSCCTSDGTCGGDCVGRCGQYEATCCFDSGAPGDGAAEGGCAAAPGDMCPSGAECCAGLSCTGVMTCELSCTASSSPCSSSAECCYPAMCRFFLNIDGGSSQVCAP